MATQLLGVTPPNGGRIGLRKDPGREGEARHLETLGEVSYNRFLLKFTAEGFEFTVFPDGRAIIKGTADEDKARTLYAKYIGH